MPGDNIYRLTWYLKDYNHLWLLGNAEFGLLVLSRKPVQIEQDIYAAVKGCVLDDMPLEDYLQEESYWESYKKIPKPLQSRMKDAEGAIRRSNPFEKIDALNQTQYRPASLKYGKAKTPVEWIDFLFESLEEAQDTYNSNCGAVRGWWNKIQGRKPWMVAFYAVMIGFPYEALLYSKNVHID